LLKRLMQQVASPLMRELILGLPAAAQCTGEARAHSLHPLGLLAEARPYFEKSLLRAH
jgi:hypothetical protein